MSDHPHIAVIHLHLDNDEAGQGSAIGIMDGLSDKYEIYDEPPAEGFKDVHDQLKAKMGLSKKKEEMLR